MLDVENNQLYHLKIIRQTLSQGAGKASDNLIINNMKNQVLNEEVTPPPNRGNAPISNKDGRPIEIHHSEQDSEGPFYEMHPSDHRYGGNYKKIIQTTMNHQKLIENNLEKINVNTGIMVGGNK